MATATPTQQRTATFERPLGAGRPIEVIDGRGPDGSRVWCVQSSHNPRVFYSVTSDGDRLHCSCPAGRYGKGVCIHRSAVSGRMLREMRQEAERYNARRAAEHERLMGRPAPADEEECGWVLTPKGRAALRARDAQEWDARETALPGYRADNRPFSIFKS